MQAKATFLLVAAVVLGCGIYPNSPLVTGTLGTSALAPGHYTGTASCNRYFQSISRPGALDSLDLPLTVDIGTGGRPVWGDSEVATGSSLDLQIGVFSIRRTAKSITTQATGLTVSYEAAVDVLDDLQQSVALVGSGAEVYTVEVDGRLGMSLSISLHNSDPQQTGMLLSFEWRATLDPN